MGKSTRKKRGFVVRNKGQVTIFIILGLLAVVFVALFFVFTSFDLQKYDTEKQAAAHVLIEQCVQDVAARGIRLLSAKGGYYHIPPNFVVYAPEGSPVQSYYPYYYKNHDLLVPDISQLEEQFSYYLLATVQPCYTNSPYTFEETGDPSADVSISENEIKITYDPKLVLAEENSRTTINEIKITLPSTYAQAYVAAVQLTAEENTDDNTFCLTCLQKYEMNGIIENIITQEIALSPNYIILYALNYTEQATGETSLFMFAGQYTLTSPETNLILSSVPDQNVTIGYPFTYQVYASTSDVTFSDNSDFFTIDPLTGLISFYPDETMLGTHLIEIEAVDGARNIDTLLFLLTIRGFSEAPDIEYIGYQYVLAGEPFSYNVTATGAENQRIYYTDDTDLFDIDVLGGTISFVPTEDQVGSYTITITAINEKGVSSTELLYLIIA